MPAILCVLALSITGYNTLEACIMFSQSFVFSIILSIPFWWYFDWQLTGSLPHPFFLSIFLLVERHKYCPWVIMEKCVASSSDWSYGWRSVGNTASWMRTISGCVVAKKAAGSLAGCGCVSGFRFTLCLCDVTSGLGHISVWFFIERRAAIRHYELVCQEDRKTEKSTFTL